MLLAFVDFVTQPPQVLLAALQKSLTRPLQVYLSGPRVLFTQLILILLAFVDFATQRPQVLLVAFADFVSRRPQVLLAAFVDFVTENDIQLLSQLQQLRYAWLASWATKSDVLEILRTLHGLGELANSLDQVDLQWSFGWLI